jgi:hypothetical protein
LQSLSNQLHDFNVGMGPNVGTVPGGNNFGTRVFWTAAVPDRDVLVNPVSRTAEMHVHNLAALDYPEDFGSGSLGPNWQTAYVPASVSFDVVWTPRVNRQVTVSDVTDQFAGTFKENHATVVWSARSASGFNFHSLAGNASTSTPGTPNIFTTYFFAQVGHEQNGVFFPAGPDPSARSSVSGNAPVPPATGHDDALFPTTTLLIWQPVVPAVAVLAGPAPQPSDQATAYSTQRPAARNRTDGVSAQIGVLDQVFADLESGPLSEGSTLPAGPRG